MSDSHASESDSQIPGEVQQTVGVLKDAVMKTIVVVDMESSLRLPKVKPTVEEYPKKKLEVDRSSSDDSLSSIASNNSSSVGSKCECDGKAAEKGMCRRCSRKINNLCRSSSSEWLDSSDLDDSYAGDLDTSSGSSSSSDSSSFNYETSTTGTSSVTSSSYLGNDSDSISVSDIVIKNSSSGNYEDDSD